MITTARSRLFHRNAPSETVKMNAEAYSHAPMSKVNPRNNPFILLPSVSRIKAAPTAMLFAVPPTSSVKWSTKGETIIHAPIGKASQPEPNEVRPVVHIEFMDVMLAYFDQVRIRNFQIPFLTICAAFACASFACEITVRTIGCWMFDVRC
jgi:hypothetical protein